MTTFKWNSRLSVNVDLFDEHHQRMFEIINALEESLNQGDNKSVINKIIKELEEYGKYHLKAEEQFFEEFLIEEDKIKHLADHRRFVEKITELKTKIENSYDIEHAVDLVCFLENWLISHIMKLDKQYAPASPL